MKTDKALEEVWLWKDQIYKQTKDMSMEERVQSIKESAAKVNKKYGLNIKLVSAEKDKSA